VLVQSFHDEPVCEAPCRTAPEQIGVLDGVVLRLGPADAGDRVLGPELGRVGQVFDDGGDLVGGDAGEQEGEEHLDGPDGVEALLVLLVLVAGDEVAGFFAEQRAQDAGLGVVLVRIAFVREGLVEFAGQVAEDAPAGRVDAVHGNVLDFEPVEGAEGGLGAGQDGGVIPGVAPAVTERELDELRVNLRPHRTSAAGGADAQGGVVGRCQVEAGLPGVEDGDDAGRVEVAGRLPPAEVLDEGRDEFAEVGDVARGLVDGPEAVGENGHLGQVVVFVVAVEPRFQRVRQALFVTPVDLLRDAAIVELELEHGA